MFLLAVGKKAFNNYMTLKNIASPFERSQKKNSQRLFFFRGPQHHSDFMMTKAVLNLGKLKIAMYSYVFLLSFESSLQHESLNSLN